MKVTQQQASLIEESTPVLIDSQRTQTVGVADQFGLGMRKTKGVKRQIVTYGIGCLLTTVIHKANVHEMGY